MKKVENHWCRPRNIGWKHDLCRLDMFYAVVTNH